MGQWNRASWGSIEMYGSPPMAISQSVANVGEGGKSCKTPASQPLAIRHLKSVTDDFGLGEIPIIGVSLPHPSPTQLRISGMRTESFVCSGVPRALKRWSRL